MWQTQDLRERVFGSVAMIGVTGDFSEVWQIQDLAIFWRKAGVGEGGVRSAARRVRMGLAGQAIDRAVSEPLEPSILNFYYLSSDTSVVQKECLSQKQEAFTVPRGVGA